MRFRPKTTVQRLLDNDKDLAEVRVWELARLLGWITLDQRAGTRLRPRRFRTRKAKQAGDKALIMMLDRAMRSTPIDVEVLGPLFIANGGFGTCVNNLAANTMLKSIRATRTDLEYVFLIVDYLCCYDANSDRIEAHRMEFAPSRHANYFSIEAAKAFVRSNRSIPMVPAKLEESWEQYKNAAPYIYSFYPFMFGPAATSVSADDVLNCRIQLARDRRQLLNLLGQAAAAADVLSSTRVRHVRVKDFIGVKRVPPVTRAFDESELDIAINFDPKSQVA